LCQSCVRVVQETLLKALFVYLPTTKTLTDFLFHPLFFYKYYFSIFVFLNHEEKKRERNNYSKERENSLRRLIH